MMGRSSGDPFDSAVDSAVRPGGDLMSEPRDGTPGAPDAAQPAGPAADSDDGRRRVRRRRRPASPADMPEHAPRQPDSTGQHSESQSTAARPEGRHQERGTEKPRRTDTRLDKSERGLRGLVGAGPSQLSISAAMRARDAARPTAADIAAAEDLPIIRRNYIPPTGDAAH
jgi:hypothetical protein